MDNFERREKRDLELYKHFCKKMNVSTDKIKIPTDKFSHYDLGHNGYFCELKTREDYNYESFNDVYIQCDKIEWLKELYENYKEKGCKGSKVIFFYPSDNKVVVIDVHRIRWNMVIEGTYDCNRVYIWKTKKYMNKQTAVSKDEKIEKDVYSVPLPHHEKINCVNVYDVEGLYDTYLKYR